MSKPCPIYGKAIYMDCIDCDDKLCNKPSQKPKYKTICIGIDQSYKNTGISISGDGKLLLLKGINFEKYKDNSSKRKRLREYLIKVINKIKSKCENLICVIERIRLRSQGFINIDYIKSIGALNSVIVDVMSMFDIKVYSVDTRCWKSQVIGTSKPQANSYGVPEEKWPTVHWVCKKGFKSSILKTVSGRKTKGTFIGSNGTKFIFDNDIADSAAISMFWFIGDRDKLKVER